MNGLNAVNLVGRLGKEPEIKYTNDSRAIANFSVATSESWKDKQGEWQQETQWTNCVFFGATAEYIERNINKGDIVAVQGKIKTRNYDKNGSKVYVTEVIGSNVDKITGGKSEKPAESNEDEMQSVPF